MNILRLRVKNFKCLKDVDIKPKKGTVKVTGPNASGKSSLLDAVISALGGKTVRPTKPIRSGASSGQINVDIGGDTGTIAVTVNFREGHPDELLVVPLKAGFTPQKFLDSLAGPIAFDPLEFASKKPKEQFDILRQLVPLTDKKGKPLDPVQIDSDNANAYKQRTILNRMVAELDARHAAIEVPDGTPDTEVDVSSLSAQIQQASEHNAGISLARTIRDNSITRTEKNIGLAQQKQVELKALLKKAEEDEKRFRDELKALKEAKDANPIDTSALQKQIEQAQQTNAAVALKKKKKELTAEALKHQFEADDLTEKMEERNAAKLEALAKAKFPVPRLSFGQDEVLYNGLPFSQASSAEKITVSVAIGMRLNYELHVMLVKESSLLDKNSMAIIEKIVAATPGWKDDGQIWMEIGDSSGEVGISMEDGNVKSVHN